MRMKPWILETLLAVLALLLVVTGFVISNLSRIITEQHARLITMNNNHEVLSVGENLSRLKREARTRAVLYDELIKRDMLLDGMVVNLDGNGDPAGVCDSLLFSSLRFYSLSSLGLKGSADEAWSAIASSRSGGQWLRHPKCLKSLSRDMVMGVLVALRANPSNGTAVFRTMLAEIDRNGGFAGDGPFYVSWLSPGIAGLLRMEAERRQIPFEEWPWILKQSFSSIEYDVMFLEEGYVSHLAALGLWLEILQSKSAQGFNPRSFLGAIERMVSFKSSLDTSMDVQRRQWIAGRLREIHSDNLFYRWLDHKAFGSLSQETEERMLTDLLALKQFPIDRLPMNCDRRADYVWQRKHQEFVSANSSCSKTYSGVDFLWMASILAGQGGWAKPEAETDTPVAH